MTSNDRSSHRVAVVPRAAASHVSLPVTERLRGRENYSSWAFAMKMVLIREGSWSVVEADDDDVVNQEVSQRALATICLGIEPINYSLVQEATTAHQAWANLKSAFQDGGMTRRMGLLRKLTSIRLEECKSVEQYVDEIMSTNHKLAEVGFKVDDTWLASILLMGLPENYEPMIMGLEASGTNITADAVRAKILQDVKVHSVAKSSNLESAFISNQKRSSKGRANVKCFKCNRMGHFASECPSKQDQGNPGSSRTFKKQSRNSAFSARVQPNQCDKWLFDSGATTHMCRQETMISGSRKMSETIHVANGDEIPVVAIGNVKLEAAVEGTSCSLTLNDTLCVPDIAVNLLSVSQICKRGHKVIFMSDSCEVVNVRSGELVAVGAEDGGLYQLNAVRKPTACVAATGGELQLWHRRLGHLNVQSLKQLRNLATGVKFRDANMEHCVPCIEGKHQRQPFKALGIRAKEVLELVHSDLCGPMEQESIGGSKYFITFIDDCSRKTFVYFLQSKKEALSAFQDFKAFVETQTGLKLKRLRSDNGKEYVGQKFFKFLKANGISHELTVPYNPEQNGLAERMNRSIIERAKAMLFDAGMDKRFWAEAVGTAVYLINRSPSKGVQVTPEEKFTGIRPDLSHLRVFGTAAMAHVPKVRRKKWDPKSQSCLFIGYATNAKGYRMYNERTGQVFVSRDVIFLCEGVEKNQKPETETETPVVEFSTEAVETEIEQELEDEASEDESIWCDSTFTGDEDYETTVESGAESTSASSALPPHSEDPQPTGVVRRSARERRLPGKYADYEVTYSVFPKKFDFPQHPKTDGVRRNLRKPTALPSRSEESVGEQHDSRHSDRERPITGKFSPKSALGQKFPQISLSQPIIEPESFGEAMRHPQRERWTEAMQMEYKSLERNGTWEMANLPEGRKALNNKWVFKVKTNADGSIERFKARLVIKGCSQVQGIDYSETYSPVVRYATIRYLLAKAVELNLEIHQLDAVTAFLQGELQGEEIYMRQPEGFEDGTKRVCRLKKALYGLKQASRVWNRKLDKELRKMGLSRSAHDTCVYYRAEGSKVLILTVYVDDFLIFSNDEKMVTKGIRSNREYSENAHAFNHFHTAPGVSMRVSKIGPLPSGPTKSPN